MNQAQKKAFSAELTSMLERNKISAPDSVASGVMTRLDAAETSAVAGGTLFDDTRIIIGLVITKISEM